MLNVIKCNLQTYFYLGPEKPCLLSQTKEELLISYENLNDTLWQYVYNATALSPDNRTFEVPCNATSNTCTFEGPSLGTKYRIYMQAFVPSTQVEYPVGSALSEPLIVDPIEEGKHV